MKCNLYTYLSIIILSLCCFPNFSNAQHSKIRVLFIGNSYTYYNNMPALLEHLSAASDNAEKIQTSLIASGGATLEDHLKEEGTLARLKEKWDYVVIQDQTDFGLVHYVNGENRISTAVPFKVSASKIDSMVKKLGGKTIVLMRPYKSDGNINDKYFSNAIYNNFAKRTKSILVPSALIIEKLKSKGYKVFREDSLHPTSLSSYCMAVGIYNSIYKKPVTSRDTVFRGIMIEESEGKVNPDSTGTLASLRGTEVKYVNTLCWTYYAKLKGGYLNLPLVNAIKAPSLPAHFSRLEEKNILGEWNGIIKLYPRYLKWPAELSVNFTRKDSLLVDIKVKFGNGKPGITIENCRVAIKNNKLYFESNKGPNKSTLRFTGVIKEGQLKGIAEFVKKDDKYFYGIGGWNAVKTKPA